jgi:hypothetical protein
MRSYVVFSVLALVGCSAAPQTGDEDSGTFHVLPAPDAGDAGAKVADAKADAHIEASAPKPTPSCPSVPDDVTSFKPSAPKPARAFQAACGAGQVTAYYNACEASGADQNTCSAWQSQNASNNSCAQCIISWDYESSWGPIVNTSWNYSFTNDVGCVELLTQNPAPSGTCAYAMNAAFQCEQAACDDLCPVDSYGYGLTDLIACTKNAATGGCKAYEDAANAACQSDAGVYAKCLSSDPETQFVAIASTFCGGS